jgi:transposase
MRFVAIKCVEQQDIQSLHRIRSLVVAHRTAQVNPYLPVRQQQHA